MNAPSLYGLRNDVHQNWRQQKSETDVRGVGISVRICNDVKAAQKCGHRESRQECFYRATMPRFPVFVQRGIGRFNGRWSVRIRHAFVESHRLLIAHADAPVQEQAVILVSASPSFIVASPKSTAFLFHQIPSARLDIS